MLYYNYYYAFYFITRSNFILQFIILVLILISTVFFSLYQNDTVSVDAHTPVSAYLLPINKDGNENKAKIENKTENEYENGKDLCGVEGEVGVLCNGILCRNGHPLYCRPGESIWEVNVQKLNF